MHKLELAPRIGIPMKYLNRHGLIAGATGTGKSVTLKRIVTEAAKFGTAGFVTDVKGDLSGIAYDAQGNLKSTYFWDVYGVQGHHLQFPLCTFNIDLLCRVMELSDAQKGVIEKVYDEDMPCTLQDLRNGVAAHAKGATLAAINRAIDRLSRMGGDRVFGGVTPFMGRVLLANGDEPSVHVLRASELAKHPVLYGCIMAHFIQELYKNLQEQGDPPAPAILLAIDEAHMLFTDMPKVIKQRLEQQVKLIRSKAVSLFFATQAPNDLPDGVLGQLGNRIQHGLRGASAQGLAGIRAAANTMPKNPKINLQQEVVSLGVGEALVSVVDHKGVPSMTEKAKIALPDCLLDNPNPPWGDFSYGFEIEGVTPSTSRTSGGYSYRVEKTRWHTVFGKIKRALIWVFKSREPYDLSLDSLIHTCCINAPAHILAIWWLFF